MIPKNMANNSNLSFGLPFFSIIIATHVIMGNMIPENSNAITEVSIGIEKIII
jgi:hypothetical protein